MTKETEAILARLKETEVAAVSAVQTVALFKTAVAKHLAKYKTTVGTDDANLDADVPGITLDIVVPRVGSLWLEFGMDASGLGLIEDSSLKFSALPEIEGFKNQEFGETRPVVIADMISTVCKDYVAVRDKSAAFVNFLEVFEKFIRDLYKKR